MLQIIIKPVQLFDEEHSLFIMSKEYKLSLEHSLISLSRWESKWHKAFLTKALKTDEETLDYIKCMTMNKDIDEEAYNLITPDYMEIVNKYIADPVTATTFMKEDKKGGQEIVTSELIYFWIVNYSIPFECEKWHLNRLITSIEVCAIKTQPKKKMSQRALLNRNRMINEQRLKQYNTTG